MPVKHPQSLPPLRLRLSINKIGQPFDLRQIQTAIFQRPTGELTRLRQSATIHFSKNPQHPLHSRNATMQMNFGAFFTRKAMTLLENQDQRAVNRLALP